MLQEYHVQCMRMVHHIAQGNELSAREPAGSVQLINDEGWEPCSGVSPAGNPKAGSDPYMADNLLVQQNRLAHQGIV